jgi:hypothetical protein
MINANEGQTLSRRQFLSTSSRIAIGAGLVASGLVPAASHGKTATARDWEELRRRLSGQLLRPNDPGFLAVARPNNLRYAHTLPAGIARCRSSQDVAQSILWCREHRVPLVARAGGHSYAGYSTTTGLMIDVSPINAARFDASTGIAQIGGGVLNAQLYRFLDQHNVTLTHGRCGGVGAAGFLLGGGVGFNMRGNGLACDQLVASEIVTADGKVWPLSDQDHRELFWACRGGGGGNFGINTSFSLQTFATEPVTVFQIIWGAQPEKVFAALMPALDRAPTKLGSRISLSAVSPRQQQAVYGQNVGVNLLGQYRGPSKDVRDILAPAYAVASPAGEQIFEMSYWQAQSYLTEVEAPPFYQERSAFISEGTLSPRALEVGFQWLRRWPGAGAGCDLRFFQTGGQVNAVGSDATAFVHRNSHWLMVVGRNWTANDSKETIERNQEWQNQFYRAMLPFTSGGAYQNFIDPSLVDWQKAYYGANLARLTCVKGGVDPDYVFRFAQSIPPTRCR